MKTIIYGAGSIGCYIGAILCKRASLLTKNSSQQTPLDVCLLGRERIRQSIIASGGLHISDYEGRDDVIPDVPFATEPEVLADADIVLVTLKCTAIESAIAELSQYCPQKAIIVCMQNGVGAADKVKAALPGHQVFAGITPFNVVQNHDSDSNHSNFHRATEGELHLPDLPELKPLQQAWQAYGLGCTLEKNIDAIVWGKLLLNLNNAINALSDIPLKSQLEQRGYRKVLAACQKELLVLCKARNIQLAKLTAVKPALLPVILQLPDWLFKRIAQKMLAIDPTARSSMWEDVNSGRKTEIDFLNGAVARLSESAGLSAPANSAVTQLIKQIEQGQISAGISAQALKEKVTR